MSFVRQRGTYVDRDKRSRTYAAHWVEVETIDGKPKRRQAKRDRFASEREARAFLRTVTDSQESSSFIACWVAIDRATGRKRQHERPGFTTRKAAEEFLVMIGGDVLAGTWRPEAPKSLSVNDLLDQWLAAEEGAGRRPGTLAMYRNTAKGWIRPHIGGLPVAALSPVIVHDLVATLRSPTGSRLGRGALSDRSVQHAVTTLLAATSWAAQSGVIGRNPLLGYKRPSASSKSSASNAWSEDEARRFLDAASEDRLRAAWNLLLSRGLRRGEICGLRWDDVDLEGGSPLIARTRTMVDGKVTEGEPKTRGSRRRVSLDPGLVAELRSHRTRQLEELKTLHEGDELTARQVQRSAYL